MMTPALDVSRFSFIMENRKDKSLQEENEEIKNSLFWDIVT